MPRTKYARNKRKTSGTESTKEYDIMAQTFDRHVQLRITKLERDAQADVKSFETFIDVICSRLPSEIRFGMTLGEILGYNNNHRSDNKQKKENVNDEVSSSVQDSMQPPATVSKSKLKTEYKTAKRTTTTTDDGYGTERNTSVGSTRSRKMKVEAQPQTTRRTRSSSRNNRTQLSEISQMTVTKPRAKKMIDTFKTPAPLKPHSTVYDVVTPKIVPNTPLNVLRRPRQGEMVLSMQGSPLLVSAIVEEKIANINVPLGNGNVMSLLPQEGLRMSTIPQLDPETMEQLETLKKHIEKVIAFK
ncbi:borealin [Nylanderia fulva]|uniref:borealin n=1 Tax=Nylanderia fulva TaxID=613905 RepID=UPI0010FB22EA|nr:borealin [Nylanderia fulva]XP_029178402.1 borealin [Nylanderia fulva]